MDWNKTLSAVLLWENNQRHDDEDEAVDKFTITTRKLIIFL